MANTETNAPSIETVHFLNGSIRFVRGNPGRPETVETTGTVTIKNAAIEATPNFFETSFSIGVSYALAGAMASSTLHIDIPIPSETTDRQYSDIENQAAAHLPQMLRELADWIEADLERAEAEGKAQRSE